MADIIADELFEVPPRWLFLRPETSDATFGTGESILIDGGRSQVMQDDVSLDYCRE